MIETRKFLILFLLCCCITLGFAQQNRQEVCVDFPILSTKLDSTFKNNESQRIEMLSFLKGVSNDSTVSIIDVTFKGVTSPDGNCKLNSKLAKGRLASLENWLKHQVNFPDSLEHFQGETITWDDFKEILSASDYPKKDTVLDILNNTALQDTTCFGINPRETEIKKLENGKIWKELEEKFFSNMRKACVVVTTNKLVMKEPIVEAPIDSVAPETQIASDTIVNSTLLASPDSIVSDTLQTEEWVRQLTLKTNALYWAMGMTNIAVDIDLAEHWSFSLPVFYSAWDYFVNDIKFRAVGFQPEFRYWFKDTNKDGWYLDAHFTMAYWNMAANGEYRYQDRNMEEPLLGGGIGFGYRMPISKDKKWKVEFSLGLGVYNAPYDKFENVPNGQLVESSSFIYYGIDQAAVSFSYTFDLKKKGGKK